MAQNDPSSHSESSHGNPAYDGSSGDDTAFPDATGDDGLSVDSPVDAPEPPKIGGLPVLGKTIGFVRDPLEFYESARTASIRNTASGRGDLVSYNALGHEFIAIFDPTIVKRVLVSNNEAFRKGEFEREFGELVTPEGVIFTEGDKWARQRLLLQSVVTPTRIESYAESMVGETVTMAQQWTDGDVIELRETLSKLTIRVLTQTLFDINFDGERGEIIREATIALSEYVETAAIQMLLPSWIPSRTERRYRRAMEELDTLVLDDLIEERQDSDTDADDVLSLLVDAEYPDGSQISAQSIRDQLVTLLIAGHDTSATTLTFACWLLADHPSVQQQLQREVDSLSDDPSFSTIPQLDYTEAVIRETMRLYPPVTEIHREPLESMELGGYQISEDAVLQLSVYGIHRDEQWWDEPKQFRPERWLDEIDGEDPDRAEYAYFPFGGGPRHCLGMRFAMTELQLALATLARRFEFERITEELDISTLALSLDPGFVEARVHERNP